LREDADRVLAFRGDRPVHFNGNFAAVARRLARTHRNAFADITWRRYAIGGRVDDAETDPAGLPAAAADALCEDAGGRAAAFGRYRAAIDVDRYGAAVAVLSSLAAQTDSQRRRQRADPAAAATAADALGINAGRLISGGGNRGAGILCDRNRSAVVARAAVSADVEAGCLP
jgi:hypothetical protein